MKYNVGDRVRIKSLDWYNENKDELGVIHCKEDSFIESMTQYCDNILTIEHKTEDCYLVKENIFNWTDEMIECKVEDEMSLDKAGQITDFEYEGLAYTLPDGYIFKDENGNVINAKKIVLEKKKKEYPKTYGYCCDTLDCCSYNVGFDRCETPYDVTLHNKLLALRKLLICRDAYWKLAGEELSLGKPWEPSDSDYITGRYCIFVNRGNIICDTPAQDCILTFPTEEMRDTFYEVFREEIEICKELL